MKQTVNFNDFERAFRDYDRYNQFGYDALRALFDYIEELEQDCGEEFELDVIALCCDWTRYDSAFDAYNEYMGDQLDGDEGKHLEWLQERTSVIEFDGGILVAAF